MDHTIVLGQPFERSFWTGEMVILALRRFLYYEKFQSLPEPLLEILSEKHTVLDEGDVMALLLEHLPKEEYTSSYSYFPTIPILVKEMFNFRNEDGSNEYFKTDAILDFMKPFRPQVDYTSKTESIRLCVLRFYNVLLKSVPPPVAYLTCFPLMFEMEKVAKKITNFEITNEQCFNSSLAMYICMNNENRSNLIKEADKKRIEVTKNKSLTEIIDFFVEEIFGNETTYLEPLFRFFFSRMFATLGETNSAQCTFLNDIFRSFFIFRHWPFEDQKVRIPRFIKCDWELEDPPYRVPFIRSLCLFENNVCFKIDFKHAVQTAQKILKMEDKKFDEKISIEDADGFYDTVSMTNAVKVLAGSPGLENTIKFLEVELHQDGIRSIPILSPSNTLCVSAGGAFMEIFTLFMKEMDIFRRLPLEKLQIFRYYIDDLFELFKPRKRKIYFVDYKKVNMLLEAGRRLLYPHLVPVDVSANAAKVMTKKEAKHFMIIKNDAIKKLSTLEEHFDRLLHDFDELGNYAVGKAFFVSSFYAFFADFQQLALFVHNQKYCNLFHFCTLNFVSDTGGLEKCNLPDPRTSKLDVPSFESKESSNNSTKTNSPLKKGFLLRQAQKKTEVKKSAAAENDNNKKEEITTTSSEMGAQESTNSKNYSSQESEKKDSDGQEPAKQPDSDNEENDNGQHLTKNQKKKQKKRRKKELIELKLRTQPNANDDVPRSSVSSAADETNGLNNCESTKDEIDNGLSNVLSPAELAEAMNEALRLEEFPTLSSTIVKKPTPVTTKKEKKVEVLATDENETMPVYSDLDAVCNKLLANIDNLLINLPDEQKEIKVLCETALLCIDSFDDHDKKCLSDIVTNDDKSIFTELYSRLEAHFIFGVRKGVRMFKKKHPSNVKQVPVEEKGVEKRQDTEPSEILIEANFNVTKTEEANESVEHSRHEEFPTTTASSVTIVKREENKENVAAESIRLDRKSSSPERSEIPKKNESRSTFQFSIPKVEKSDKKNRSESSSSSSFGKSNPGSYPSFSFTRDDSNNSTRCSNQKVETKDFESNESNINPNNSQSNRSETSSNYGGSSHGSFKGFNFTGGNDIPNDSARIEDNKDELNRSFNSSKFQFNKEEKVDKSNCSETSSIYGGSNHGSHKSSASFKREDKARNNYTRTSSRNEDVSDFDASSNEEEEITEKKAHVRKLVAPEKKSEKFVKPQAPTKNPPNYVFAATNGGDLRRARKIYVPPEPKWTKTMKNSQPAKESVDHQSSQPKEENLKREEPKVQTSTDKPKVDATTDHEPSHRKEHSVERGEPTIQTSDEKIQTEMRPEISDFETSSDEDEDFENIPKKPVHTSSTQPGPSILKNPQCVNCYAVKQTVSEKQQEINNMATKIAQMESENERLKRMLSQKSDDEILNRQRKQIEDLTTMLLRANEERTKRESDLLKMVSDETSRSVDLRSENIEKSKTIESLEAQINRNANDMELKEKNYQQTIWELNESVQQLTLQLNKKSQEVKSLEEQFRKNEEELNARNQMLCDENEELRRVEVPINRVETETQTDNCDIDNGLDSLDSTSDSYNEPVSQEPTRSPDIEQMLVDFRIVRDSSDHLKFQTLEQWKQVESVITSSELYAECEEQFNSYMKKFDQYLGIVNENIKLIENKVDIKPTELLYVPNLGNPFSFETLRTLEENIRTHNTHHNDENVEPLEKDEEEEKEPGCCICLEDILPGAKVIQCGECKKELHEHCATDWIKNNATCPTCRALLKNPNEYPALC